MRKRALSRFGGAVLLVLSVLPGSLACGPAAPTDGRANPHATHTTIPGRGPLTDAAGRINPGWFDPGIRDLESVLYQPGPTTLGGLEEVYVRSGWLAEGLLSNARHLKILQDEEREVLERAGARVETLERAALLALIHWDERSTLDLLRRRWEAERARLFQQAAWFRHGGRDLDASQSRRDPEGDGDLHAIIDELQSVADECGRLDSWSYEWSLRVAEATRNRRPRRRDHRGPVRVVIPYEGRDAQGPRALLRVYEELDYVRALLRTEAGTYHWVDADRSRRISEAVAASLAKARRNLAEMEGPPP